MLNLLSICFLLTSLSRPMWSMYDGGVQLASVKASLSTVYSRTLSTILVHRTVTQQFCRLFWCSIELWCDSCVRTVMWQLCHRTVMWQLCHRTVVWQLCHRTVTVVLLIIYLVGTSVHGFVFKTYTPLSTF